MVLEMNFVRELRVGKIFDRKCKLFNTLMTGMMSI